MTHGTVNDNDQELFKRCRGFINGKSDGVGADNSKMFSVLWQAEKGSADVATNTLCDTYRDWVKNNKTASDQTKGEKARDFIRELFNKKPDLVRKQLGIVGYGAAGTEEFLNYYIDESVPVPPPPAPSYDFGKKFKEITSGLGGLVDKATNPDFIKNNPASAFLIGATTLCAGGVLLKCLKPQGGISGIWEIGTLIAAAAALIGIMPGMIDKFTTPALATAPTPPNVGSGVLGHAGHSRG